MSIYIDGLCELLAWHCGYSRFPPELSNHISRVHDAIQVVVQPDFLLALQLRF